MNGILFLFFAFLLILSTIKLTEYTYILKNSDITNFFVKNILSVVILGIPILVTYLTSLFINNPYLAISNIIGSNIFNFVILAFLNIIFIKKNLFKKISPYYFYINSLLVYIYIVIINILMIKKSSLFKTIGPNILVIIFYFIYLFFLSKINLKKKITIKANKVINIKFFIYLFLVIIFSIILTLYTDYLSFNFPKFSSSIIGLFLLGITTSLPKIISSYTLIKNNYYDLVLSDIIGSNMFNFLLLTITNFFFKKSIYFFITQQSLFIIKMTLYIHLLFYLYIIRNKALSKIFHIIISLMIIVIYLYSWKTLIID